MLTMIQAWRQHYDLDVLVGAFWLSDLPLVDPSHVGPKVRSTALFRGQFQGTLAAGGRVLIIFEMVPNMTFFAIHFAF